MHANTPNNLLRAIWALLFLLAAPLAFGQGVPEWAKASDFHGQQRLAECFHNRDDLLRKGSILSHTPWSVDATTYRYLELCAGVWPENSWGMDVKSTWRELNALADNAPGNLQFAKTAYQAMGHYVNHMQDSELRLLTSHLGRVARELPRKSNTWILLQSWRASNLTLDMRWQESIPLLREIEEVLNAEGLNQPRSIKPVYAHLDCAITYMALGIPERVAEHQSRAAISFQTRAKDGETTYMFEHLLHQRVDFLLKQKDYLELENLLDRARQTETYAQLTRQTIAYMNLIYQQARIESGRGSLEPLEGAFETLMNLTDLSTGSGEWGDQPYRSTARLLLGEHYMQNGAFDKARALHEQGHLWDRTRVAFERFRQDPLEAATIPTEVTAFLPHFQRALNGQPIPLELQGWVDTAYSLRLKETSNAPLLPLGISGDAHADTSRLAECAIQSIRQDNLGQEGTELSLQALLRREAGGTLARHLSANIVRLEDIKRTLLGKDAGIYHIHVGWTFVDVFLIDRKGTLIHRLDSAEEFSLASGRLIKELHKAQDYGGNEERLERAVQRMQAFLLPPGIARDILQRGWKSIAFSGFEGRSYVPMELLELPDGRRLGDLMPVTYYPSLTVAMALANRRETALRHTNGGWRALIATSAPGALRSEDLARMAQLGSNLQSLPFTENDRKGLFGNFPDGIPLQINEGAAATQETLWDSSSQNLQALLVLGHGSRDNDLAASPGLLLRTAAGSTTVVGPTDLADFHAPPLTILIACGTTDAVPREGDDGAQHLVGTLLRQGSDTVISAHLPLRYDESKRLTAEILKGITNHGLSPAEALWKARVKLGDDAGYPGRYLLHASGLADRALHEPRSGSGSKRKNTFWMLAGLAAAGLVLIVRSRAG